MLALAAVMVSYVVEEQDWLRHSFDRDPTLHWCAAAFLGSPNRRPFDTSPHPAQHLKTWQSGGAGAPARQVPDSKDVCH